MASIPTGSQSGALWRLRTTFLVVVALISLFAQASGSPARFSVDPPKKRFTFDGAIRGGALIQGARLGLDVNGKTLWADEASVASWKGDPERQISNEHPLELELRFQDPTLVWRIHFGCADDRGTGLIQSNIENTGDAPIKLGRCRLADVSNAGSQISMGAGSEASVLFVMSGTQANCPVRKIRASGKHHVSKTLTELYNANTRAALHVGFLTFDRLNTEHEVWWDEARGTLALSSSCDFEGFQLASGRSVDSEGLVLQAGQEPLEGLQHWADLVQKQYRPVLWPKIPAGWAGWSWVDPLNVERYEGVLRRNAKAIRDRLPGLDLEYIWVSIGNLLGLRPGNWLQWNRELFPSGPEVLIHDLGRMNFRLGLWAGPFYLSTDLKEKEEQFREALLLRNAKPMTVPFMDMGVEEILDPTHPKTKSLLRDIFSAYRQWGVRYFMIDFLNGISGSTPGTFQPDSYFDRSLIAGPQAYREGLRTIREAVGADTYLISSSGPTLLNIGLVDATRTGSDYGEGRPLSGPGKGFYPGTFVMNQPDYWNSHMRATGALAGYFFTHRKLFLADSGNLLSIDRPIPLPDAQISATIFGINGGPMILGDDIDRIEPGRLEMIKQLFPRLPECAVPLDLFESPEPDYPKIFHLAVKRSWGEWDLVAIFNYGRDTLRKRIEFSRLGRNAKASQIVWDFWNERYLGPHTGGLDVDVPPRSVRLLRVAEEQRHPSLLATDMHVRQGQAEIDDLHWDAERLTLRISAQRPASYRGNAYIHVPKGLALKNPLGLWIAKDGNDGTLIVRCAFIFPESGTAIKTLEFERVSGGKAAAETRNHGAIVSSFKR